MAKDAGRSKDRTKDRTKYGSTPKRSGGGGTGSRRTPLWQAGCRALLAAFLWLMLSGAGVGLVVHGAFLDLPKQFGRGSSPLLHMTVDSCVVHVHGRSRSIDCVGHGDPGSSDVLGHEWAIRSAEARYAPGTVVAVRCGPAGDCEESGTSEKARDVAETAFGLLLTGAMVAVLVTTVRSRRGRSGAPSRRTVRAGIAAAVVLGAVGLAAAAVALAT